MKWNNFKLLLLPILIVWNLEWKLFKKLVIMFWRIFLLYKLGVGKKLDAISKKKCCEVMGEWASSIKHHLYWSAASSGGDGQLIVDKWLSVCNHVANVHSGHGGKFLRCEHGPLERKWMLRGTMWHRLWDKHWFPKCE